MQPAFKELFDNCVDHYASEREHLPYFRAQIRIMQSMLSGEPAGTVLDLGCAAGAEIHALREMGHSVFGADLSEQMVQMCRQRFAGDKAVRVLCAEADRIPLAANSVDHAVCLGVFEFLPDYRPAIAELARVVRPGGMVVLAVPQATSVYNIADQFVSHSVGPLWRLAKRRGRAAQSDQEQHRPNLCVPWKFRQMLREAGLAPLRDAYSNYFLYPLDRFPALDVKVAAVLEPLASLPVLKYGAAVYLISARKAR
jgi:ubiquinone/menaquinone biosynthesis C-methylase UbiE